jgi:hypothetical protein|nr:MAG TPA: hypothetical protein [Caudoviricetes sp.]
MPTAIRAELSNKNKYWVEKHRYYELKHFCLQYPFWRKEYSDIDGLYGQDFNPSAYFKSNIPSDPTFNLAEKRVRYFQWMKMIEQAAIDADPELVSYILKGVTEGASYTYLKSRLDIPCSRDTYYDRYRRFFWLLDQARD